ncbi:hypothetical protein VPH35_070384 [Triticum aestivum]
MMAWFASPVVLGAVYVAALAFRLVPHLAVCLRRPKDLRRSYGTWAVTTGPTSGIGWSLAVELARSGLNLVLIGRDPAKLQDISQTICRAAPTVKTKTLVLDLSLLATAHGETPSKLHIPSTVEALDVGVLEPGAVFLHEAGIEELVDMIRVNLLGLTEVTAAVIPGMVEHRRGAVVNMGSASSEAIPSLPLYTMYAATKRYVAQFSRSLHLSDRAANTILTSNPIFRHRRFAPYTPTPETYVRTAVQWIGHAPLCVPNLGHRIMWFFSGIAPDFLLDEMLLHDHLWQRKEIQRMRLLPTRN